MEIGAATAAAMVTGTGAVMAAVGAYLADRRARSGHIESSEAKDLWAESAHLRQELRAEIDKLRAELGDVRVENTKLRAEVAALKVENSQLRRDNEKLTAQIAELTAQMREGRA